MLEDISSRFKRVKLCGVPVDYVEEADLNEFIVVSKNQNNPFFGWDGYQSDSYFSGILVKYVLSCCGEIIVGRYMS